MAITLIIEDGTNVANANTYASLAYARLFAESVGITLPADDEAATAVLLSAMAYIESRNYKGQIANPDQALVWPRKLVVVNGVEIANNVIPLNVKKAQVQAASMIASGTDLLPTVDGQLVTEETVGPITTKYSDEFLATWDGRAVFTSVDTYLQAYLIGDGGYRLSPAFGF